MGWYPHRTPVLFEWLMPSLTFHQDDSSPIIYLTFDDGPDPNATPWVLEQLARVGGSGTFFMVGDQIRKHPQLAARVIREGHSIGNHTYHHLAGWQTDDDAYLADIQRCQDLLPQNSGQRPLFRPPYGRITPRQVRLLTNKYKVVMWSLLSGDFDRSVTPDRSLAKLDTAKAGDIVVFHDSSKFMPILSQVLPEFLKRFQDKGFKFAAIS